MQASCSLQFVPWDVSCEEDLTKKVGGEVLAFAVQKVQEIVALADAVPDVVSGARVSLTFQRRRTAGLGFSGTARASAVAGRRVCSFAASELHAIGNAWAYVGGAVKPTWAGL